jgi:hypothetical protein
MGANGNKVRDAYVEEVEFLRSCGCTPAQILDRLHVAPGTLTRALYREGRPELARLFGSAAQTARRRQCVHCGQPCDTKTTRCWSCRFPDSRNAALRRAS